MGIPGPLILSANANTNRATVCKVKENILCRKFDVNSNEAFYNGIFIGPMKKKFASYVRSSICGHFQA